MLSRLALGIFTFAIAVFTVSSVVDNNEQGADAATTEEALQGDGSTSGTPSRTIPTSDEIERQPTGEQSDAADTTGKPYRTISTSDTSIVLHDEPPAFPAGEGVLLVSASPLRDDPVALVGSSVFGSLYIFLEIDPVEKVEFWLDDPDRTGPPIQEENHAPYDFAGGLPTNANAFDARSLSPGPHSIVALATTANGSQIVTSADFEVVEEKAVAEESETEEPDLSTTTTSLPGASTTTSPNPTTTTGPTTTTTTPATTTTSPSTTTSVSGTFDAVVHPGESIQAAVDGLWDGARVLIASGVHVQQQVKPKSGMTFVGESGAVLDGQNSAQYAFFAWSGEAVNVTVRGLEITGYVQAHDPHGAIYVSHTSGWVIEDCEIHHNAYSGINIGTNSTVRNSYIHHNGRIGVKASGTGFRIEGNEISHNNPNNAFDPLWEAGGIKFIESNGGLIRNNHVHDNHGPGIWADVSANSVVIEGNRVESNTYTGIDYEISSHGVIRNNTVRYNGLQHPGGWMWGAGITVRSPNVEVYGNVVQGNKAGIALIQTDRGYQFEPRNVVVRNNVIIDSGQSGGVRSGGTYELFSTSVFRDNEYRYADINGEWWRWNDAWMTKEQWTAAGHDQSGVFVTS